MLLLVASVVSRCRPRHPLPDHLGALSGGDYHSGQRCLLNLAA